MKAVLDTNVVVSRYVKLTGPPAHIFELLREHAFQLVVSSAIMDEYWRVLLYPRIARRHRRTVEELARDFQAVHESALVVEPKVRLHVIAEDTSDNKFLECAVEGEADYIVSGDRHLLGLGRYEGIEILPPAVFVMVVGRGREGRIDPWRP